MQKANLLLDEQRKTAEMDYTEIFDFIRKLDEVRFVMNKQMGPGGPMAPDSRKRFMAENLDEHDKLLQDQGFRSYDQNQPMLDVVSNNPSKAYFGNAGIAGDRSSLNMNSRGSMRGGVSQRLVNPHQQQNQQQSADNEDDFWYQGNDGRNF